jgi:Rps23 Pro-64 3,4-dihydroxylase Tpa1-like proline 4-hydroxylase
MFPIKYKPKSFLAPDAININDNKIIQLHNVIDKPISDNLKRYAIDINASGLHKRKNDSDGTDFYSNIKYEFNSCQVHRTMNAFGYNNDIYEILNDVWLTHALKIKSDISYIEPYEIKMYNEGDYFDSHNDGCVTNDLLEERKVILIIQLSEADDYTGGDLYIGNQHISREFGSAVFFSANYPHYVTKITKGNRVCLVGRSWGPYTNFSE